MNIYHVTAVTPSEADVLDRIRASDPDALDEAIRRYWNPLLRYAAGLAPDLDSAEDAVQEVFIRLWTRRQRWRSSESLQGLLFRVLRNELLNGGRSRRARHRLLERMACRPVNAPVTPVQLAEERDLSSAVERAMNGLPERRREAFVLVRHAGLSYREAAQIMGVSSQTIANHVSAALTTLRDALSAYLEADVPPDVSPSRADPVMRSAGKTG